MNENYAARIITPRYKPHPDPETTRLKIASWSGLQFLVGIEHNDKHMILFPAGSQVGEEFAAHHDLIRRKDDDGNPAGGMLEQNRRIKAIKLRGVQSEGLLMPLSAVSHLTDVNMLKEGDVFEELNGIPVCKRYMPPVRHNGSQNQQKKKQVDAPNFVQHVDTDNFRYHSHRVQPGDRLIVTLKVHGTCLDANTNVYLQDGNTRKLKQVRPGDVVKSPRNENGAIVLATSAIIDDTKKWVELEFDSFGTRVVKLVCTTDHLFDLGCKPDGAHRGWITAEDLIETRRPVVCHILELGYIRRRLVSAKTVKNRPCYDITTSTGDFVANKVVVHNSHRTANVPYYEEIVTERSWWKKLLRKPADVIIKNDYRLLTGSRRVVMHPDTNIQHQRNSYYGDDGFRYTVTDQISHAVGRDEIWFGEIVGYLPGTSTPIMSKVDTTVLKDKAFTAQYGKEMVYNYGCVEGTMRFMLYRIAVVSNSGMVYDLPWETVKARAEQAGVECVPDVDLRDTVLAPWLGAWNEIIVPSFSDKDEHDVWCDMLVGALEPLIVGPDVVGPSHIKEGVVVRRESQGKTFFYKLKSFQFLQLEGVLNVAEIEDVS